MSAPVTKSPLAAALAKAAHLLPDQGPIGVFIHHNTLHGLQHLPFDEALTEAARILGAEPWLAEGHARSLLAKGRIALEDVRALLPGQLDELLAPGLTRGTLRFALMEQELEVHDAPGTRYLLELGQLPVATDRALWDASARAVNRLPVPGPGDTTAVARHHDALVALGVPSPQTALHAELQRLASAFLDKGQASFAFPSRGSGFFAAVRQLYVAGARSPSFAPKVAAVFRQFAHSGTSGEATVEQCLRELGVGAEGVEGFVVATLLAFPGWAGLFSRLERHPGDAAGGGTPVTLVDFLAVRLVYEQEAIREACRVAKLPADWRALSSQVRAPAPDTILRTHLLCGVARAASWSASQLEALSVTELERVFAEVAQFDTLARRRVFHAAYERTYRRQVLGGLAERRRHFGASPARVTSPTAQFVFCIDEREESIRRALEEQSRAFETFGVAGFFGMAIDYQGLDDAEPAPYAPAVVTPAHEVHEEPLYTQRAASRLRRRLRDGLKSAWRLAARASRTVVGGALGSLFFAPLAAIAVVARVLAPRSSLALGGGLSALLLPRPATRLASARTLDNKSDRGKWLGFTLQETVDRVAATLTNIGLTREFAPVVVVLGHGSTSLNNPHESAHDCGACGGRRGGANARLFAAMANRPEVREGLRTKGITVPEGTWFIGALHDTADDAVTCFDLDALPATNTAAFDVATKALEQARRLNAQERSRRFEDASLTWSPERALEHVEERASHLGQPRPEYGHCTNATCIVGRRALSRGLHLDRRAFLVSYDAGVDDGYAVLTRILSAVGPVGAGISLEYYFSSVDNARFGCGTKLPHNVTGLLGVMNGHQGDLLTGLPVQMVELHEPMRLLLVVEATPEALLHVASQSAEVKELVVNRWVQLVSVDPVTGAQQEFTGAGFVPVELPRVELPVVKRSAEWHLRSREHLGPALVEAGVA